MKGDVMFSNIRSSGGFFVFDFQLLFIFGLKMEADIRLLFLPLTRPSPDNFRPVGPHQILALTERRTPAYSWSQRSMVWANMIDLIQHVDRPVVNYS